MVNTEKQELKCRKYPGIHTRSKAKIYNVNFKHSFHGVLFCFFGKIKE